MPTFNKRTPGVYIEEVPNLPPSITAVATAIPVFIGYTERETDPDGVTLINRPVRITSRMQYQDIFGPAKARKIEFEIEQTKFEASGSVDNSIKYKGGKPAVPEDFLPYSIQLFYDNGGGPCYVISIGKKPNVFAQKRFEDAIDVLEKLDEPTLIVFPDAAHGSNTQYCKIADRALAHCAKMQDRFAVIDVPGALGSVADVDKLVGDFRTAISNNLDQRKYGAAYFPYLQTSLPIHTSDPDIKIVKHKVKTQKEDGSTTAAADGGMLNKTMDAKEVKEDETAVYDALKGLVAEAYVTLPPSAAVAGVYARVDAKRGVFKAPANESIDALGTDIEITNDLNATLNVDPGSGKSINVIRKFTGKGILVWGARTLAGNDRENRYVPVRRFLIYAEESIKKAIDVFVFEPNNANTWVKVRSMIEGFLLREWRAGALMGAKPQDAFYVTVGLNKTMSAQDVLDGYMIVEIGLAIVRPAEFIILRFVQKMPVS